jgi:hypothetical protein
MVHASRYRELAPLIARLIPELEQAVRASAAPELTEAARELLTDTYQVVAAMMAKLGETDAAWIAADRAAFAAEMLHDRLAVAASLFRMAHVFLTFARLARPRLSPAPLSAARDEQAHETPTTETLSLCGAFHLVLAIAAARDNDRAQAHEHLNQAHMIAKRIGEDRDDFGTEFGPTNVALHAVGVAVGSVMPGRPLTSPRASTPESYQPNGRPGMTSTSSRRTPCDGRSARPCAAWKKPSGSLPSRRGRTGSREQSPVT